jgi:hypothetical protein
MDGAVSVYGKDPDDLIDTVLFVFNSLLHAFSHLHLVYLRFSHVLNSSIIVDLVMNFLYRRNS